MKIIGARLQWQKLTGDSALMNKFSKYAQKSKSLLFSIFKFLILVGISYIILGPIINIISHAFFSPSDVYNPSVFLFPFEPTTDNFTLATATLDYWRTLGSTALYVIGISLLQILMTSMAGYGFARFDFPFKKLLFGCVVLTIILPTYTIMLPLYTQFRNWDVLGLIQLFTGHKGNLLHTPIPMFLLTLFGSGLRSGLFIYIFRQFFRGLPKEIEEAALIDGAGTFYTYFRIMLVNAAPSVLTVGIFSMVWQYNDIFYAQLFAMDPNKNMTFRLSTLPATVQFVNNVQDPLIAQSYAYAGVVLALAPILLFYLFLQKYFMESMERSGIVG